MDFIAETWQWRQELVPEGTKLDYWSFDANLTWMMVSGVGFWLVLRQILLRTVDTTKVGRYMGLLHAGCCCLYGLPILFLMDFPSLDRMVLNLVLHSQALNHSAQKLITMSLSYFIVDSFTMLDRKYLQHHIATIVCMLFVLLQPMTSTIHASVVLSVFELGALMVQASRWVRNDLRVRFAFCTGYTGTRILMAYYYMFILYATALLWHITPLVAQIAYVPILTSLGFLVLLNAKWASIQWSSFFKMLHDSRRLKRDVSLDALPLYEYHQKVIGNKSKSAPANLNLRSAA